MRTENGTPDTATDNESEDRKQIDLFYLTLIRTLKRAGIWTTVAGSVGLTAGLALAIINLYSPLFSIGIIMFSIFLLKISIEIFDNHDPNNRRQIKNTFNNIMYFIISIIIWMTVSNIIRISELSNQSF